MGAAALKFKMVACLNRGGPSSKTWPAWLPELALRIVKQDLEVWLYEVPKAMELDPLAFSCRLGDRPATACGKALWPKKAMPGGDRALVA